MNGKAGETLTESLIEVQNRFFKILDCDWLIASKYGQPLLFKQKLTHDWFVFSRVTKPIWHALVEEILGRGGSSNLIVANSAHILKEISFFKELLIKWRKLMSRGPVVIIRWPKQLCTADSNVVYFWRCTITQKYMKNYNHYWWPSHTAQVCFYSFITVKNMYAKRNDPSLF